MLWGFIDTKIKMITIIHPHKYRKTKVVSMMVVDLLRGYCSQHPKLWDELHHCVQHAYNRAMHYSTQKTPFEVCLTYFPK